MAQIKYSSLRDSERGIAIMADYGEEKGSGAWARVPVWDGSPATWKSFKREMTWWVSRALSATIWQRGGQV